MNISDEQVRAALYVYLQNDNGHGIDRFALRVALEAYERARAPDPRVTELQRAATRAAELLDWNAIGGPIKKELRTALAAMENSK